MPIPTPHITAKLEDFAETVIMPGDPKRSAYIAKNFLDNAVLVNDVRGVQGWTGYYKGKRVSVMAHGMGMPSMAIYSYELFNFYNVKNIIRVGSCGGITPDVRLRDIILANPAVTDSNIAKDVEGADPHYSCPSKALAEKVKEVAKKTNTAVKEGMVLTSDMFYYETLESERWESKGAIACEMESYILYTIAKQANKNAVCLLTVSDHKLSKVEELTAEERQNSFNEMLTLALNTAIEL